MYERRNGTLALTGVKFGHRHLPDFDGRKPGLKGSRFETGVILLRLYSDLVRICSVVPITQSQGGIPRKQVSHPR